MKRRRGRRHTKSRQRTSRQLGEVLVEAVVVLDGEDGAVDKLQLAEVLVGQFIECDLVIAHGVCVCV